MPDNTKPRTRSSESGVMPAAVPMTERPRRLAACGADPSAGALACWKAATDETGCTHAVIAAVLGVDESLVSRATANGTITSLQRLSVLGAHEATAECVRLFAAKLHSKLDERSPERDRVVQQLRDVFEDAMVSALKAQRRA